MKAERLVSIITLLVSVYGGVWSVLEKPTVAWVFLGLIAASLTAVVTVWSAPDFNDYE